MKTVVRVLVLGMIAGLYLFLAPPAGFCASCGSPPACSGRCPNAAWWSAYSSWCTRCGGTPYQGAGGGGCRPGPNWGGSSSGGGGGLGARDQAILGIAGALGQALGESLRQQAEEAELRRQQEILEAEARAAEELARYQAEQQRLAEERERKHKELLTNLKATAESTELGLKDMGGSETLQLKPGTSFFGIPSNPSGTMAVENPAAGLQLKIPNPPESPKGAPVQLTGTAEQAWKDYLAAIDRENEAQARLKKVEDQRKMIEQVRQEAEKRYREQETKVASVPPDQRKAEDDKLAEAQRLFEEATRLDQEAARDLDQAQKDAEAARKEVTDREQKKQALSPEKK